MDFILTTLLQSLALAPLAVGVYLSMKLLNVPDITADGSYVSGAAVTALLISRGFHPLLGIPLALSAGMISGSLTALIYRKLKIPALLSGILMMSALYSINLIIMGKPNIPLNEISSPLLITISRPVVIVVSLLFLSAFIIYLLHTDLGLALQATGMNETMALANGINTHAMNIAGLAFSNACAALSGFLITLYQGYADVNMGIGIVLSGLAAVMIADALRSAKGFQKPAYSILLVIGGMVLFRLLIALALSWGADPAYLKLINSLLVLVLFILTQSRKLWNFSR